jgi:hypothetical protein
VYVGQSNDVERRYHGHFVKGRIPFLPTIDGLERMIHAGTPSPFYEVVDTVPSDLRLVREREVFEELKSQGFVAYGGR